MTPVSNIPSRSALRSARHSDFDVPRSRRKIGETACCSGHLRWTKFLRQTTFQTFWTIYVAVLPQYRGTSDRRTDRQTLRHIHSTANARGGLQSSVLYFCLCNRPVRPRLSTSACRPRPIWPIYWQTNRVTSLRHSVGMHACLTNSSMNFARVRPSLWATVSISYSSLQSCPSRPSTWQASGLLFIHKAKHFSVNSYTTLNQPVSTECDRTQLSLWSCDAHWPPVRVTTWLVFSLLLSQVKSSQVK